MQMPIPTHRDWPNMSGHEQSSLWSQREYAGLPSSEPREPSTTFSTSVETDPSEDMSEYSDYVPESIPELWAQNPDSIGENSPNSVAELGLRDISDPGPEGSHQGHVGRMPTEPSDSMSPEQYHRTDTSIARPLRAGPHHVPSRSSSGSPSVTSRRQCPRIETPPVGVRQERRRSRSNRPNRERTRPRRAGPTEGSDGDSVERELRGIMSNLRNQRRPRERRNSPPPSDFLKMVMMMQKLGTQKFFGNKGPLGADSWLKHVERNFNASRCPEDFRTDVAVHYLMNDACTWWDGVKNQYPSERITWDKFKTEFERKYFPPEARDRMEARFQNLVQGPRSVRDYEAEFTRLRQYAHYGISDEPVVIRKFLRGLRPQLMSRLVVNQYYSLFELVERAVDVEEGIRIEQTAEDNVEQRYREQQTGPVNQVVKFNNGAQGRGRGQSQGRGQGQGRGQNQGRGQAQGQTQGRGMAGRGTPTRDQVPGCYKCGNRGHYARACPNGGQTSRPVPLSVICFTCNQPGHYATTCPVTHPTGPTNPNVGLRAMEWEIEPPAKRPAIEGRIYSLDKPEPTKPSKRPVSGT